MNNPRVPLRLGSVRAALCTLCIEMPDNCATKDRGPGCCAIIGAVGSGCSWTSDWSCPGKPAGRKGVAQDDGSDGWRCCCIIAFANPLAPSPPHPPPSPPRAPRPDIPSGKLQFYGREGKLWVNDEPLRIKGISMSTCACTTIGAVKGAHLALLVPRLQIGLEVKTGEAHLWG